MTLHMNPSAIAGVLERGVGALHANNVTASLVGYARQRGEVGTTRSGAISAMTGVFTGRSPKDKFIVADKLTRESVWWENSGRMDVNSFDLLLADMLDYAEGRDLFRQQLYAGADPARRYNVDVFSESAWHMLFIRHLLIRPDAAALVHFNPNVSVVHMPGFKADPARHGTKSDTCIALDLSRNIILICGTFYAGEIKKSVFSLFNFHAPAEDIFPMHCSANVGKSGDTTLFFGLSGTGKTTLSTSANRALVGDDEHGWSADGIFNLEGGCYAKAINLSSEGEPEIYAAAGQFGAVLENVTVNADGLPDYGDDSVTENTRIAYPLTAIPNRVDSGLAPAPKNLILLAADAFGVLPPLARLTDEQAIYYFLSGYTAKLAGTERGVTEPQATFSACFGAPFMARHPVVYGEMLARRMADSGANVWLLNTGWTGGGYGVGTRMALRTTRRLLDAALGGELDDMEFRTEPHFGLSVPVFVDGVDTKLLNPALTWVDKDAYGATAKKLVGLFDTNFAKLGSAAAELVAEGAKKSNAA